MPFQGFSENDDDPSEGHPVRYRPHHEAGFDLIVFADEFEIPQQRPLDPSQPDFLDSAPARNHKSKLQLETCPSAHVEGVPGLAR
ncbi:hypothetical protein N181_01840 [Sinorhizobium fredii USDA 205]|nr:hypothetical protein N181_01840 [Sinorhizobium fredii USDA 205]